MGMDMTSEESTYNIARERVNQWRLQLRRVVTRQTQQEREGDHSMATFSAGVAEGLAQAVREMDRVLDDSPICKQYTEAAR